ncbi:MAG: hypothetical protein K8R64_00210 [Methanosarcinaceae archaeon]|nr:hypothetical protein [Methanosarcinaceae archaeon]
MDIYGLIISTVIFGIFSVLTLFALINLSSIIALLILIGMPLIVVLVIPSVATSFLSQQHIILANGAVPINNYHILLLIWSTLIGIILYTEFLTWYMTKARRPRKDQNVSQMNDNIRSTLDQVIKQIRDSAGRIRNR